MAPSPSSRRPLMRRLTAVCVFSVFSGFFCTSVDSFRPNDAPNSYPDPAVSEHTTTQGIIQPDAFSAVQTSTRVSTNEEGASLAAYMDLQRALEASAAGVSVDLPHSTEFAEAFVEYKNTGICDSWTDSSTNKVSAAKSGAATTAVEAGAATSVARAVAEVAVAVAAASPGLHCTHFFTLAACDTSSSSMHAHILRRNIAYMHLIAIFCTLYCLYTM